MMLVGHALHAKHACAAWAGQPATAPRPPLPTPDLTCPRPNPPTNPNSTPEPTNRPLCSRPRADEGYTWAGMKEPMVAKFNESDANKRR